MRQIRLILGFLILLSLGSCSTHDPQQMPPDFFLDEAGAATSQLLSDRVLSLAVDSRYLWVGTDRGLSRYDKAQGRWNNFTVKDGLAHNHVLSIALDDLQVWIGTRDGVSRYELPTSTWTRYMPHDGLAGREVSSIAVDSRFIWFGTPNGLSRYDKETNSWARKREDDGLAGDAVTQISIDDDYIWVGTENGVSRYDKLTDSWNNYDKDSGLIDNSVTAIAADENSVWFGTENKGLSRYDQRNSEFVRAYTKRDRLTSDQINALAVDGTSLWLGTADSGAQRYILSVNTWREYTAEAGLPSNHITAIAADGNVVWLGTYEHGLARYDLRSETWRLYGEVKALSDNDVKDILATDESIWVATRSGLNQAAYLAGTEFSVGLNWRTLSKAEGLADDYITTVTEVGADLWLGTPRGLGVRYGGEDRWTFFTTKDGLAHDFVTCIAWETANNGAERTFSRLWIGTRAGLSTYEPHSQKWNTHPSDLQISGRINDIKLAGSFVWIATIDGLVYHDRSANVSGKLTETDGLPLKMVNTIAIGDNFIWVGTPSGLARLDKSIIMPHVSHLDISKILVTRDFTLRTNVRAIVVDGNDTIWIGTPSGLGKYNIAADVWTHYTRENTNEGLASDNVKTISKNSNKIWVGTIAGASCLDEKTGKWSKHLAATTTEALHSNWVSKLVEDGDGLWFGNWKDSTEGAIVRYNRQTDTFRFFSKEDLPLKSVERPITRIHALTVGENEVWVGTNGGLLRYDKRTDMWRHYTTEDGLPNNEVWTIVLDAPYLWTAHIGGVVSRYSLETDGWKTYEIVPSVEWSNIGTIAVDPRYVWVTTVWEGIKRYDKLTDQWSSITEAHGLGNNETNDLLIEGDYIWVTGWGDASRYNRRTEEWEIFSSGRVLSGVNYGIDRGLDGVWLRYSGWSGKGAIASKYNNKTDSWTTLKLPQMEGVDFDRTMQVVETADAVWFAADEQGLARYNKAAKDWTFFSEENGLASNDLIEYSLVVDDNYAWVGTAGGLSRYDLKKEVWTTFTRSPLTRTLRESKVYAIAVEARYVWLATTNGLHRYDKRTDRWFAPRLKEKDEEDDTPSVTCLAIDEKYAWLGTNKGILRYDKAGDRWETYAVENGLPSNTIRDLDVRGYDLWISTDRGVATFNRLSDDPNAWESHTQALEVEGMGDDKKYAQALLSDDVRCVAVGEEMVWFGTDKGTCRYDREKKTWEVLTTDSSVLGKIGIRSDSDTTIGSSKIENPENREIQSNLTDTSVIVIDGEEIWFGTGKGATKYNIESGDFVTYTRSDGLASDVVTCIALNGVEIWFGSADAGVTRLDKITGSWRVFDTDDGLLHNRVEAIAFDGDQLWFGTERGLCRYNQATGTWTSYAEN